MIPKILEKEKAIKLRKDGFSYSEILLQVPVAKSSLALWLQSVGLSKRVQHQLTEKKRLSALRGAATKHRQRLDLTEQIFEEAENQIGKISKRELWLMGVMLYWAEGSKEKTYRPGSQAQFSNSDAIMCGLFLKWLLECVDISRERIYFEIYIHENSKNDLATVRKFWSKATGFSLDQFNKIYFKKNKIKTNRMNIGNLYNGVLRIRVKASSNLNRKITGWINGIGKNCGVVQR